MPRPPRYDDDAILDAALRSITRVGGPPNVSLDAVAAEMGGNSGSIYYRFPSRDHLFARLWIRCAQRGQVGMIAALAQPEVDAAFADAVLHYPRWAREDLAAAQVLATQSRELLVAQWPDDLAADLAAVNQNLARAVRGFAQRRLGSVRREHLQASTFALLDLPVAAIRRYLLAGKPPPESLDAVILAAAGAALRCEEPR
ncbi:MAG: TetR/AcrR family transcriptional regulator [Sporichthyaceae bacterium]